jgi:hypothetical protein
MEEAKGEVLMMVNKGINFREVYKVGFLINGKIKKFSIPDICKSSPDHPL